MTRDITIEEYQPHHRYHRDDEKNNCEFSTSVNSLPGEHFYKAISKARKHQPTYERMDKAEYERICMTIKSGSKFR